MNTTIEDADLEKLADTYADDCGYPQSDKEHFETTYWTQHNIAKHSFISGYKAKEAAPEDFKEVTGFDTPEEMTAYSKGRDDEETVFIKFISEWNGETNSHAGQSLKDAFDKIEQGNSDDKQILLTKVQEQEIEIASLKNKVKELQSDYMAVQTEIQSNENHES